MAESTLILRTDERGYVIRDDETAQGWRKKVSPNSTSDHSFGTKFESDPVVAFRRVSEWKSSNSHQSSKSLALTKPTFDLIVQTPFDLPFYIQQFVYCRGAKASVYRLYWDEVEHKRYGINVTNDAKYTDILTISDYMESIHKNRNPFNDDRLGREEAFHYLTKITPAFIASSSSQEMKDTLRKDKLRGKSIMEPISAMQRIVNHIQAQVPGLQFQNLCADFVRGRDGKWWMIKVVNFDATCRYELSEEGRKMLESATQLPIELKNRKTERSRKIVSTNRRVNSAHDHVSTCSLCGHSCDLPQSVLSMVNSLVREDDGAQLNEEGDVKHDLHAFGGLKEYRLTLKMVTKCIFQIRQRGDRLVVWEDAVHDLEKQASATITTEVTLCHLCYTIFQQQQELNKLAHELHTCYSSNTLQEGYDEHGTDCDFIIGRLNESNLELRMLMRKLPNDTTLDIPQYRWIKGADIDPTSSQLRLSIFFHEVQDGGPSLLATDYYLEYQLGQSITRVDFDGGKGHTPNRWQLCETRIHYLCSALDTFTRFCDQKHLYVKMRQTNDDQVVGYAVLKLKLLIDAATWCSSAMHAETRSEYIVNLKTVSFGVLTLKATLGLILDHVPLRNVREVLRREDVLQENPRSAVYWLAPSFHLSGVAIPMSWIDSLTVSEYVTGMTTNPSLAFLRHTGNRRVGLVANPKQTINSVKEPRRSSQSSSQLALSRKTSSSSIDSASSRLRRCASTGFISDKFALSPSTSIKPSNPILEVPINACKSIYSLLSFENKGLHPLLVGNLLRAAAMTSGYYHETQDQNFTRASLMLTDTVSVDSVLCQIHASFNMPTVGLLGELLLVMNQNGCCSTLLDMEMMEETIEEYWLQQTGGALDELVPRKRTEISPHKRVIWNRAVRRRRSVQQQHCPKLQMVVLVLCAIFELAEVGDSEEIELTELRSVFKYISQRHPSMESLASTSSSEQEKVLMDVAIALERQQHKEVKAVLKSVLFSSIMEAALSEFDTIGYGATSFAEFTYMTTLALQRATGGNDELTAEQESDGFCILHGPTKVSPTDFTCNTCATEDYAHPKQTRHLTHSTSLPLETKTYDMQQPASKQEKATFNSPHPILHRSATVKASRSSFTPAKRATEAVQPTLLEPKLKSMLQRLDTAESRMRQSASELALGSIANTSRRRLSPTSRHYSNLRAAISAAGLLQSTNRLEDNKHTVTQASDPVGCTGIKIVKSRRKTATGAAKNVVKAEALKTGRKSLSELLANELYCSKHRKDGSATSRPVKTTSELIGQMTRAEKKRKQLDRRLLSELDQIKQRLEKSCHPQTTSYDEI